jgi:quinol monooxygenase YgiN
MITMIARMRVPPENAAAYEELMTHVADMTLRNEPGVPYYAWAKSADEPDIYVVVEVYQDEKVHAAHMASEWVRNSIPVSRRLVEGGFDITQYVSPGQAPVKLKHG